MCSAAFSVCWEWEKESNCPSRWQNTSHADWDMFCFWYERASTHTEPRGTELFSSLQKSKNSASYPGTVCSSSTPWQKRSLNLKPTYNSFKKEFLANGWTREQTAGNRCFWTKLLAWPQNLAIAWVSQAEDTQVLIRSSHEHGLQPEHHSAVSLPLENLVARLSFILQLKHTLGMLVLYHLQATARKGVHTGVVCIYIHIDIKMGRKATV